MVDILSAKAFFTFSNSTSSAFFIAISLIIGVFNESMRLSM